MASNLQDAIRQNLVPWTETMFESRDVVVFVDGYPVTKGHLLFVPRLNNTEAIATCFKQAQIYGQWLVISNKADGYNIGMNFGQSAGQTVMYPHVHLIPRYIGDCEDPIGGVRAVILGQANYKKSTYNQPKTK